MAGLALRVGGFGGVGSTSTPQWGTTQSYDTVTAQAFGPGATVSGPSGSSALAPNNGFGVALWVGVASVCALVLIRHSLPG